MKNKTGMRVAVFLAVILFGMVAWVRFMRNDNAAYIRKYHDERMVIGTLVQIDVCALPYRRDVVRKAMAEVWQRFEEIDERMNAYDSGSEVGRINEANGAFVEVHEDLYALIRQAVEMSHKTGGTFDITVRPLIDLWNWMEEEGRMPAENEVLAAKTRVGIEKIRFVEHNGVAIACEGCALDLGGIAKGYAVDEASRILRSHGFRNFLIDAGGDMYAAGKNAAGEPWRIGVRDPKDPDKIVDVILLSDQAVATSGDYEQFYEIANERFSHIIDPATGYSQKGVVSATVVAPTAVEADVFSTALCIWGGDRGLAFIERQGVGYGAFMIMDEGGLERARTCASEDYVRLRTEPSKKTE